MNPDVDAYIAALPPLRRDRLEAARAMIHAQFGDVREAIEWKMPVFRRGAAGPGAFVALASQKSYVSVYFSDQEAARLLTASDPRLKGGKACVNITDSTPWPEAAVHDAIAAALGGP
ncbi:MAG: DUF1801 domain-containing protein [Polymorphobacter sp.]